jgi:hypothetical protein
MTLPGRHRDGVLVGRLEPCAERNVPVTRKWPRWPAAERGTGRFGEGGTVRISRYDAEGP